MTIRSFERATVVHEAGVDPTTRLRDTPRVLSIAGTDPTGGAGIQADLKSIGANGGYGMAVITSLVAQNTRGVRSVHTPPASFLREQLQAVSDDVHIDAVKIGMLGDVETIETVRGWLAEVGPAVVVLDPVMVATSGDRLLADDAESALRALLPFAHLVTPNVPELAVLAGEPVAATWGEAVEQGRRLSKATGTKVLVKGGHLTGSVCPDALVDSTAEEQIRVLEGPRIVTDNTHGTGCSLSSALATVQARTGNWWESLVDVKRWLTGALERSSELEVGQGNGPIHHFHASSGSRLRPFSAVAWEQTALWRSRIHELTFVRGLRDGSLAQDHFAYYLAQDALYLGSYSRVLARASALAPTETEQLFWATAARNCIQVEAELHRTWLQGQPPVEAGPVTKAYVNHLLAASAGGSYGVLIAAVLPCYWLYADVGSALHDAWSKAGRDAAHPYAAWIETYADPAFAEATAQAISVADAVYAGASATERSSMLRAFDDSAQYELEFFDAPRHHG